MQRQESSVCYRETKETVNQKAQNKATRAHQGPPQQRFPYCAATSRPNETRRGPVWESLVTSPSYHFKMLFTKEKTKRNAEVSFPDFSCRCRRIQVLDAQTLLTFTIANAGGQFELRICASDPPRDVPSPGNGSRYHQQPCDPGSGANKVLLYQQWPANKVLIGPGTPWT